MNKCPACGRTGGALTAAPHCHIKACTWNKCQCGATYDRGTGQGFGVGKHYPTEAA